MPERDHAAGCLTFGDRGPCDCQQITCQACQQPILVNPYSRPTHCKSCVTKQALNALNGLRRDIDIH